MDGTLRQSAYAGTGTRGGSVTLPRLFLRSLYNQRISNREREEKKEREGEREMEYKEEEKRKKGRAMRL